MADIAQLEQDTLTAVAAAGDEAALEAVRVAALGKNGSVTALLKTLGTLPPTSARRRVRSSTASRIASMPRSLRAATRSRIWP